MGIKEWMKEGEDPYGNDPEPRDEESREERRALEQMELERMERLRDEDPFEKAGKVRREIPDAIMRPADDFYPSDSEDPADADRPAAATATTGLKTPPAKAAAAAAGSPPDGAMSAAFAAAVLHGDASLARDPRRLAGRLLEETEAACDALRAVEPALFRLAAANRAAAAAANRAAAAASRPPSAATPTDGRAANAGGGGAAPPSVWETDPDGAAAHTLAWLRYRALMSYVIALQTCAIAALEPGGGGGGGGGARLAAALEEVEWPRSKSLAHLTSSPTQSLLTR